MDGVVDDDLAVAIVFTHHVDGPIVDGFLEYLLLCVDPDPTVLRLGSTCDVVHGFEKLGWRRSVFHESIGDGTAGASQPGMCC